MAGPDGTAPLDPAVLAAQTGGDRELEAELFGLFEAQADRLWPAVAAEMDAAARSAAAHMLKGGAAAIGAVEVMRLAGEIEAALDEGAPDIPRLVAALAAALADARVAIAAWRAAHDGPLP